jgi:hypothetical protein
VDGRTPGVVRVIVALMIVGAAVVAATTYAAVAVDDVWWPPKTWTVLVGTSMAVTALALCPLLISGHQGARAVSFVLAGGYLVGAMVVILALYVHVGLIQDPPPLLFRDEMLVNSMVALTGLNMLTFTLVVILLSLSATGRHFARAAPWAPPAGQADQQVPPSAAAAGDQGRRLTVKVR